MKTCGRVLTAIVTLSILAIPLDADAQRRGGGGKDKPDLPLDSAATIQFTTDEATWLSLDVTPDGESIVFELVGDLYTLPIDGGKATRVTDGMGFDSQPRVSPDGQWIAFISDRDGSDNLWIAKVDGSEPRKLSKESQSGMMSPAWTADSEYVLVSKASRGTRLWMYHIKGGSGLAVGSTPRPAAGAPQGGRGATSPTELGASLSSDGRYLYYATRRGNGRGGFPVWQIARRDMRTGDVDNITQAEGSAIRPEVSPDGGQLVYGTRHETQTGLRIRDLETGADRWLVYPVQRDQIETGGSPARDLYPNYAFTPDGQWVLYTADGGIRKVRVSTGQVETIPFEADVTLAVGPDLTEPYAVPQGPVRARLVQDPRLSPDGTQLAFSVLTKNYVMSLPDGEPERLTESDAWEFKPTWSPDGEWIAYVTWSTDGGQIWKARANGRGGPQQLTTVPAFYTDVTFSPDGNRIVGLRGNAYQRNQTDSEFGGLRIPLDLVWLPADGGDVKLIVPARGVGAPHFAGDPERVFVYSREGLISMRYDGTDRRTHLKVTGRRNPRSTEPPAAQQVLLRPDGKWALAASANQLWVVAVPPSTGTTPSVSLTGPAVPVEKITDIGADYFAWADGGETLTWAIGSTFFQRPFDSIEFDPEDEDDEEEAGEEGDEEAAEEEEGDEEEAEEEEEPKTPLDEDESVESVEIVMEFPRAKPTGTIALRGATVITMEGDEIIENADVVVTDNRIAALGPRGSVTIPSGAREMDVGGMYITPGFVDTHAHWEFRTHDVLEPHNWSLLANLAYGVTAGLDVQTSTNDYFAYQDMVETGQTVGQRAFMTGPGVFSSNNFQSYDEVLSYLKRYKHHYRTPNIKSYMVGNRKQRQWVVKASEELGLMPTTEGGRNLKLDMTHALDGFHGNEHTLPVVPLYKDVVELFAQTKTAYTPTLLVLYGGTIAEEYFYTSMEVHDDVKLNRFTPHAVIDRNTRRRGRWVREDEHVFDDAAAQAAKIQRAGGLIGVGGHGQLQGLGYHWEMWSLAMGGMTPREVLKAATIDGARIIGFDQDLGSLAAGKLADLVILGENPLEDIRNTNTVQWVMKNGELYEGDTLKQIWPMEKELPPLWWWESEPSGVATGGNGR